RGNRSPVLWNIAADHIVNRLVKSLSDRYKHVSLGKGWIFFENIHNDFPEINVEDLYDLLKKDMDSDKPQYIKKVTKQCTCGGGNGQSQKAGNDSNDDGDSQGNGKCDKCDGYKTITVESTDGKSYTGSNDTDIPPKANPQEVEKNSKNMESKGRTLWHSPIINKGNMPGELVSYMDDIFEVEIPWHEILTNAILYHTQSDTESTWARRNIYIRNVPLPYYGDGTDVKVLVAVIDSSGSVSDADLKIFAGVILSSLKHFKSLCILVHDTHLHQEFWFENEPSQMDIINAIKQIEGRGGTSHKDVFDRMSFIVDEEDISVAVFLTDFESDVEQIYRDYHWLREIPNIWVLNRDHPVNLVDCPSKRILLN
ncbi:MAG: hypothetical protein KAS32_26280, partial [Candidatus Peribacteraceae bacterium]|nr:hypothetical protein [Candidatus Peribacteraceae bacterium]